MARSTLLQFVDRDKQLPMHVGQAATFTGNVDMVFDATLKNGVIVKEFVLRCPTVRIWFPSVDGGPQTLDAEYVVDHVRFRTRPDTVFTPSAVLQLFSRISVQSKIVRYRRSNLTWGYGPDYARIITGVAS